MSSSPDGSDSMLAALAEEARIAGEFRAAWGRGETPSIAQFVKGDAANRLELLLALASADLACRLERGQAACVEMYLRRWPELTEDKEILVELIRREWQARAMENPGLVRFELRERFPEIDTLLAELPPPQPPPTTIRAGGDGEPDGKKAKWPKIPGYEILGELGEGGMGMVYKARQVAAGRVVALKMIHPGLYVGAERFGRFRREAEATARLSHPNIVQIHEVGEHAGQPYFSLEFCEGGTLAGRLAGQPLTAEAAARLMQAVASAVDAAHKQGVIHRDLKPGNILLTADGTPKVADFGLARQLDGDDALTATNQPLGTPRYMAPEQVGGAKTVGPAADVWALGVILYECFTGRPPFLAASTTDVLMQVKDKDPVSLRQINPSLPRDLDTITLKCLQKDPARRYASAADLAEDLRRWQANEPIKARPVGRLERGVKWARRYPAAAGLIAALAVVVAVTGGMLYNMARAGEARKAAAESSARSRWVSEIMIGRVEDPLLLDAGAYTLPEEIGKETKFAEVLRRAARKTNQQLSGDQQRPQRAALLAVIGSGYRSMGMYDQAQEFLQTALKLWREEDPNRRQLDVADTLHLLGSVHHERGRFEKDDYEMAKRYYREAMDLYAKAGSNQTIETRLSLASLHQGEEDYPAAMEIYRGVKEHYETRNLPRDRSYIRAWMGLITDQVEQETVGQDFKPLVVQEMLFPIQALMSLEPDKTWETALNLFQQGTMKLNEANEPGTKPEEAAMYRKQAEAKFRECAAVIQRDYKPEHNYRGIPLYAMATSMADRGDWAGAAEASLEAVKAFRDTVGLAHEKVPYLASRAAFYLYRRDNNPSAALKLLDDVLAAVEKRSGTKHHLYGNALIFRAWFFKKIGDPASMRREAEAAKAAYLSAPLKTRYRHYRLCDEYLQAK
jgi:tetratricopeptide (TPR) repeat protein